MKKILETLQRKWAEYLLEMVVIMVSIIGAFMLDRWKEQRDVVIHEKAIIQEVLNNLERDIERIPPILNWYGNQDSIAAVLLSDNYDKDSISISVLVSLFEVRRYEVNNNGYQKLLKYSNNITSKFQNIIPGLEIQYGKRTKYVYDAYSSFYGFLLKTFDYYQWNYPWYSRIYASEEARDYFNNSPEYKNFISTHRLLGFGNYRISLGEYWTEAVVNYYRIVPLLNNEVDIPAFVPKNDIPITDEDKQIIKGQFDYDGTTVDVTFDHFFIFENYQKEFKTVYRKISEDTFVSLDGPRKIRVVMDSTNNTIIGFKGEVNGNTFLVNKLK